MCVCMHYNEEVAQTHYKDSVFSVIIIIIVAAAVIFFLSSASREKTKVTN